MKPQHSRQRMIHNLPQRIYRSRRIFSIPEYSEGRDMDHEPARAPETQNHLDPGTSAPEPHRRDFRYEDSRRADSDGGNSGTERHTQGEPGQAKRRSRMHQHGNQYQQRFQEAAKAEEPKEKPPEAARRGTETGLPSWNLPLTNSHQKQRIRNSPRPDGKQNGQRKSWEQAENRLPARHKLRMETSSEP